MGLVTTIVSFIAVLFIIVALMFGVVVALIVTAIAIVCLLAGLFGCLAFVLWVVRPQDSEMNRG